MYNPEWARQGMIPPYYGLQRDLGKQDSTLEACESWEDLISNGEVMKYICGGGGIILG